MPAEWAKRKNKIEMLSFFMIFILKAEAICILHAPAYNDQVKKYSKDRSEVSQKNHKSIM